MDSYTERFFLEIFNFFLKWLPHKGVCLQGRIQTFFSPCDNFLKFCSHPLLPTSSPEVIKYSLKVAQTTCIIWCVQCTLVNNSQGTFKGIPRRPTTHRLLYIHVCIGVHALLLRHYFTYDVAYLLSSSCEPSYENVFYITTSLTSLVLVVEVCVLRGERSTQMFNVIWWYSEFEYSIEWCLWITLFYKKSFQIFNTERPNKAYVWNLIYDIKFTN